MTTPLEIQQAMLQASRDLQRLIDDHPRLVVDETEAEKLASLTEATTLTQQVAQDRLDGMKRTVQELGAIVTKACVDERYKAALAKGLRESNKLAIQAAMQRLSALQSLSGAMREELKLARYGSDGP